jgi:hypothetical protein
MVGTLKKVLARKNAVVALGKMLKYCGGGEMDLVVLLQRLNG